MYRQPILDQIAFDSTTETLAHCFMQAVKDQPNRDDIREKFIDELFKQKEWLTMKDMTRTLNTVQEAW